MEKYIQEVWLLNLFFIDLRYYKESLKYNDVMPARNYYNTIQEIIYQENKIKDLLRVTFLINMEIKSLKYPFGFSIWLYS